MDRRDFIKIFSAGTVAAMGGQLVWRVSDLPASVGVYEDIAAHPSELAQSIRFMSTPAPNPADFLSAFEGKPLSHVVEAGNLDAYLEKMMNFEAAHQDDLFLDPSRYSLLISTFKRLDRVQNLVGHGNFNVLSFDEMLKYASRYESVGEFPRVEVDFLDELFSSNAQRYGFFGEKVISQITAVVKSNDTVKVPYTGHFLYKGDSHRLYDKLKKDVGRSIVLTSGIRSVVKQSHLFLAKTIQSKGNMSRASRSLAPPGHSFHGIGDFDVGKIGYGPMNFTSEFARTDEFKRLVDLGYVSMRYPQDNLLGVRYEPWHIKVV